MSKPHVKASKKSKPGATASCLQQNSQSSVDLAQPAQEAQEAASLPADLYARLVSAGRAFKRDFDALTAGERAMLRRDCRVDHPSFKACSVRALRISGLREPVNVDHVSALLLRLVPIAQMRHLQDANHDHGACLGSLSLVNRITHRRVEKLIGATAFPQMLGAARDIIEIGELPVDFGKLLADFAEFTVNSTRVRRRWWRARASGFQAMRIPDGQLKAA